MNPTERDFEFDAAYRGEVPALGEGARPPWSIGEPQPVLASLIDRDMFHGEVLDAGCGEAALSLELALRGYHVVGVDISPTGIGLAAAEAARRGLTTVSFEVADVTSLRGYDGRFGTIVDSALLHALPPEQRAAYQQSIAQAATAGASYFVLAFDKSGMPTGPGFPVSPEELDAVVSPFWIVDEIEPARIHANLPDTFGELFPGAQIRDEPGGRKSLPGWLLCAHRE